MKRKLVKYVLTAGLALSLLAGCGSTAEAPAEPETAEVEPAPETPEAEAEAPAEEEKQEGMTVEEYKAAAEEFETTAVYTPEDHEMTTVTEGCYTFTDMVNKMKDGMGYTNVRIGDMDVLVVASGTYQWEEGTYGAIDAEIFCYSDSSDTPRYLGYVQAGGTAYPLSVKNDLLYIGGNHFMIKYTIKNEELIPAEEVYVTYDTDGKATYFYKTEDTGFADHTLEEAETKFGDLFGELDSVDILNFDTIGGTGDTASDGALPRYTYPDDDPIVNAIVDHMIDEIAPNYSEGEVSIPQISEIAVDESDPADTKVWGDFWVFNYNCEDDLLKTVSGGAHPGLFHLAKNSDGSYTVTGFDPVEDGSNYEPSAKKIFGDKYDDFAKISADSESREFFRKNIIREYVEENGLHISGYQDYGWDPVLLNEE